MNKINYSNNQFKLKVLIQTLVISIFVVGSTYLLYLDRYKNYENKILAEQQGISNLVAQELSLVFSGIENDIVFYQKIYTQNFHRKDILELISKSFISSHSNYFNLRLVDLSGNVIYQVFQNENGEVTIDHNVENIEKEGFFQDIKRHTEDDIYISPIDLFQVKNEFVKPWRPTIRVAKKFKVDKQEVIFFLNIEASLIQKEILEAIGTNKWDQLALVDQNGKKYFSSEEQYSFSWIVEKDNKIKDDEAIHYLFSQNKKKPNFKNKKGFYYFTPILTNTDLKHYTKAVPLYLVYYTPLISVEESFRLFLINLILFDVFAIFITGYLVYRYEMKSLMHEISQLVIKEQESFIGNVTHQLKTPLSIIKNDLRDLIFKSSQDQHKEKSEKFESMREEIDHLLGVVDNLLFLSRINTAPTSLVFEQHRIDEILVNTVSRLTSLARKKEIRLNIDLDAITDVPENELIVEGEEQLLICMLENIVENAIKYSPVRGNVDVRIEAKQNIVKIDVKDNGVGVLPENVERIFQQFFRENRIEASGTGLGLALAYRIAKIHKGTLKYLPNNPNGSIFSVELPSHASSKSDL